MATAVFVPVRRCGPPESPMQMPPVASALGFWLMVTNHWLTETRVSVAKRLSGS